MGKFLGCHSGVCPEGTVFLIEPTVVYIETPDRKKVADKCNVVVRSDPFWGTIKRADNTSFSCEQAKELMAAIAAMPIIDLDAYGAAFFFIEDRTPEFYPVANYWDEVTGETEPLVVMQKD